MMAPDLILCKEESSEQEEEARDVKEIIAAAAAEASTTETMLYCNPWSSEKNSPRNSDLEPNPNNNNNSNPSSAVPIVTLKTREALRNFSFRDHDEEIWQLKRALLEKDMELRKGKVHAAKIEAENRFCRSFLNHSSKTLLDPHLGILYYGTLCYLPYHCSRVV